MKSNETEGRVCAVKFVMNNGLESQSFDCQSNERTADKEFTSIEVQGHHIKRVVGTAGQSAGAISKLIFESE